jgi:hypothetical protein
VTKTRDEAAALRFLKKALKRHGKAEKIVIDGLRSCPPAGMRDLGNLDRREMGPAPQQSSREFILAIATMRAGDAAISAMMSLQKFASVHPSLHDHFGAPSRRPPTPPGLPPWRNGTRSPLEARRSPATACQMEAGLHLSDRTLAWILTAVKEKRGGCP